MGFVRPESEQMAVKSRENSKKGSIRARFKDIFSTTPRLARYFVESFRKLTRTIRIVKIKSKFGAIALVVTTLALSGCGSGGPSNSDVRHALIKAGEHYDAQIYYRLKQIPDGIKRSLRNAPPTEVIHMLDKHVKMANKNDKILGCSKVAGATYRCSAIVAGRKISFGLDKAGRRWVATNIVGQ